MLKRASQTLLLILAFISLAQHSVGWPLIPASFFPPDDNALMARINTSIDRCYFNRDDPSYAQVNAAQPPEAVRRELERSNFGVKDFTDRSEDVSFIYELKWNGQPNAQNVSEWTLMVSMVGPYAALFRIKRPPPNRRGRVTTEAVPIIRSQMYEQEQMIVDILTRNRIEQLGFRILERRVNLKCQNTRKQNVRVYQALFVDRDGLPWLNR